MSDTKPHVHLLATGGTIANPPAVEGYVSGREVVDSIPELDEIADVSVTDVASKASSSIAFEDWLAVTECLDAVLAESVPDGVVVTHGSNSAEETAYFLHLTLNTHIPVAVTAAQRNFRTVGNDGNRNLLDAVRAVTHPEAGGRGVFVVVNDQIHSARDVTKVVSSRPDAWQSGDFGPLGLLDKDGLVQFYRSPDRAHTLDADLDAPDVVDAFPRIEIVHSAVNTDGSMVEAAVERGADGIVVAAYPTGSPAKLDRRTDQRSALERVAADGVPVVITHRGTEGWPSPRIRDERPFIWGDTLTPQKARILLGLGLHRTRAVDDLQELFLRY